MINLKKHDPVADAVNEILQQEALKGNQHKIDANQNNRIDGEDFKILRGKKKKVEEELKGNQHKIDANHNNEVDAQDFKILRAKKKVKEETEQIDELSINTLTRVKGAATSAASDASREGDEGKATKRYDLAGKASNKIETKNRAAGLKPSGQHAFEEVEQIDELSKSTLGSYLDKKKSEYMKGKTQSGSKENAKDIQNMGKAHDKMKKEEYTLKQMKERLEEPVLDELINEVLSKDASAGAWIHDFVHSDNPKFAGKSTAKRKEMALGAYYSKKNEEVVQEGLKDAVKTIAKKTFKALTGGSDKDHLDRLKKDMYKKEETETVEEGWDDMVKDAKEKVKSGPKPSGGSGVKQGTRYGGAKQAAEKPSGAGYSDLESGKTNWKKENDLVKTLKNPVKEGKDPNMDAGVGAQPNFATDMTKPMKVAQSLAKKSLGRMRNEMMGKKNV